MLMDLIQVNQEKCIRCGLCATVCPTDVIGMDSSGPKTIGQRCIACGHCVAVCPKEALDNINAPLANQTPLEETPVLDSDTAARFLRSRRSIRSYKETTVPREKILQLLSVARLAPTGGNTQGISYFVIDNKGTLHKITATVIDWMEEEIKKNSPWAANFSGNVTKYRETGKDVILRGAPCLIIAKAPKDFMPRGRDNAHFSLTYAELFAPTIELGTCWAGYFEACALSGYQPLLNLLQLPEKMVVTGGLMVGYPRFSYKRLVDRNPLDVTFQ